MKTPPRRHLLSQALALGPAGLVFGLATLHWLRVYAQTTASPRVIEVIAQRFKFTPNEIHLKAGERVVLEVKSLDFVHGLNLPDFGMRFDLAPGKITRIELQLQRSGTFDFLCDNFCGDGHENMHGRIVVSA